MASNPKLNEVKTMFSTFYNNFFFDNKDILRYLNDITAPGGNVFDLTSKKILCLEIHKNGEQLFRKNNEDTAISIKYFLILDSIYAIVQSLVHIIRTSNNNYYDIYQNIQKVKLLNTPPSSEVAKVLKIINNGLETKYMIDTDTLYIYDSKIINLEFKKVGYKYKEHMHDNIIDDEIISNNIFFMLSLNEYNLKSQIFAYYYYIIILKLFALFYYNSEYLIDSGTTDDICEYFNNEFITVFVDLKNTADAMISSSGQNVTLKEYNAQCTGVCPVSLDIIYGQNENVNNFIILNKDASLGDEYVVIIDQEITDSVTNTKQTVSYTYEITNASYLYNEESYLKIPKTIILKAYSTEAKGCGIEGVYPSINIVQNQTKLIKLRQKTISDMRRDYILNGKELGVLNSNIIKSKDKINRMVKNYDKQISVNKGVNMQMNIYKWIFIILSIIFIVLFLGNFTESIKLTTCYAIFVLILIMLIINYYIKYDYIEPFENAAPVSSSSSTTRVTVDTTECSALTSSSPLGNRLNFIQNNMTSFVEYALQLVVAYHLYLSSLDSLDLFKKMSGAMKTEMHTFKEHEKYYQYKEKMDNKTIDILKHEMIANTGYVNMLTFMYLIVTIFFICYFYKPDFVKSYIIIALALAAINMAIYYLVVLRPVRTRARTNYWSKPSQTTLVNL